jgi:hypothetical protein
MTSLIRIFNGDGNVGKSTTKLASEAHLPFLGSSTIQGSPIAILIKPYDSAFYEIVDLTEDCTFSDEISTVYRSYDIISAFCNALVQTATSHISISLPLSITRVSCGRPRIRAL